MADEGAARPDAGALAQGETGVPGPRPDALQPPGSSQLSSVFSVVQPDAATAAEGAVRTGRVCPWCSAEVGTGQPERCPSCGAALVEDVEAMVPGVTTVDPEAVRRATTWERVRKRSTFRGFLATDREESPDSGVAPSSLAALAPPSPELRLEMERLRLELEEAAQREAQELEALAAAALAERGEPAGGDPAETPRGDRLELGAPKPEGHAS
jgi:hypothetical protein